MDEPTLAHYQHRLLQLLRDGVEPADIRRTLLDDPVLAGATDYLRALDDDALRVATRLVAKWGQPL